MQREPIICVVGLGYVGLPLAHAFAKAGFEVIGYDIKSERIAELKRGNDRTLELSSEQLEQVRVDYTTDPASIERAAVVIIVMPTPVDEKNKPDLSMVRNATATVGKHLRKGAVVVYESTVYPGVTEEICGPILEKASGLKRGTDFKLGYSPERINPGDKEHTIDRIVKVVAGEDERTTELLAEVYGKIVTAGIHKAPSIKVAEMAKAIENAQRDLNVAYINEIAMMCGRLGIATKDVLAAARTKWNFLPFTPGLVGGHCIGVDPYYLLEKAKALKIDMPIVASSRKINDSMAKFVAEQVVAALKRQGKKPNDANILLLGLTFKENIPDTRNSKANDVIACLKKVGCTVATHDPYVGKGDRNLLCAAPAGPFRQKVPVPFDAILLLVPHREYLKLQAKDFAKMGSPGCIFYDLKSVFRREELEKCGMTYLAL